MSAVPENLTTSCAIAGGGPAGMMLGYLLARAGIEVIVLEKHVDFLRDFRGDTVHPSTLEVMYELGLLDEFLKLPHQKLYQLQGQIGDYAAIIADFSHLKVHCPYIAFMPQWDFLNFLASHAKAYPNFHLLMQTEATDLIEDGDRITGIIAKTPQGNIRIQSKLVIGTDGRHSTIRSRAGLQVEDIGAPMDVLWLRISRREGDPSQALGRFVPGKIMALINRQDYWQCAYVIPKGAAEKIHQQGLGAFRAQIAEITPFLSDRIHEIKSWDDVKLLTVVIDHLRQWWRPGLLCIGDAAHAMSPMGGVGINLAVQDAVAAANILIPPLKQNTLSIRHLQAVQKRREWPVRMTQRLQVTLQNRIINTVLTNTKTLSVARPIKWMQRWPILRRLPGYLVGIGFRAEHIRKENFAGS
jgi:2-polyprenyl-6-methoxyphenol hydroxylase-like FAD-dependent oxidoreductase